MEGLRAAVAEGRGPHRDRGPALDLTAAADHAARAAADQDRRRERLVHALERGLGRRQVRAGGEDADHVGARATERRVRLLTGLDRREARVGAGGQPTADAHAHLRDDTPAQWPPPSPFRAGDLRADRRREDGAGRGRRRAAGRPRRAPGGGVGRRPAGLPGARDADRRPVARRARDAWSTAWSPSCRWTRASRWASTPTWPMRRSTACSPSAPARSSSAARASTCVRRSPS